MLSSVLACRTAASPDGRRLPGDTSRGDYGFAIFAPNAAFTFASTRNASTSPSRLL